LSFYLPPSSYASGEASTQIIIVDWGGVSADPVVAAAMLDQLLHHAAVINIKAEGLADAPLQRRDRGGQGAVYDLSDSAFLVTSRLRFS
jgi:hypothetical protein